MSEYSEKHKPYQCKKYISSNKPGESVEGDQAGVKKASEMSEGGEKKQTISVYKYTSNHEILGEP